MTRSEAARAKMSFHDVANLYVVILGRQPESHSVVAAAAGRDMRDVLRELLMSHEFFEFVFTPIVRGELWPAPRFTTEVTKDISDWILVTFELEAELCASLLSARSWPAALLALLSNHQLSHEVLPEYISNSLAAFITNLETIEIRLDEDAAIIGASDFFEAESYSRRSGLVFDTKKDAARHYLLVGARRGWRPSRSFNPQNYCAAYDDVRNSKTDPLVHYIRDGVREGRSPRFSRALDAELPFRPLQNQWSGLIESRLAFNISNNKQDSSKAVDVIIPVYRGIDDTLACIFSVLSARNITPHRVIVIDDKSPEEGLSQSLEKLAEDSLITLLTNSSNLGFVKTVNRGMMLSKRRDVILLNSDTEVFGDWIDRLRAQVYGEARIATSTPFSNNATIFSYPHYDRSNHQTLEVTFEELDRIAAKVNRGTNCIVPTGVGYCMYIRRVALDEIGFFDEELFGKGYGEENDFCMRAIEHAWDNVAAFDVFVRHTGEVSFAVEAESGKRSGYLRLTTTHPRYDEIIGKYIHRDPFKGARGRLDVARFGTASGGRAVLMIWHGWGGGIEKHISDLTQLLYQEGIPTLVCTPLADRSEGGLSNPFSDDFPNLPNLVWSNLSECAQILRSLNLGRVHIHSVVGISDETIDEMVNSIRAAGLEYDFTVHDYAPVCPRITMIDRGGSFCGSPSADYCRECISRIGTPFGEVDIDLWRARYGALLNGARKIIVPDDDVADRLNNYMILTTDLIVRPHPVPGPPVRSTRPSSNGGGRTIGIIGAIGEHKGSRILRMLCVDALERRLPIQYVLYGYTDAPDKDVFPNLNIVGHYADADFVNIISSTPCDIALYLSVWPETFSFTLDHAFNNRIYPVSFDIGAIAGRIRRTGFGETCPLDYMYDPTVLNDYLMGISLPLDAMPVVEPDRTWISAAEYYENYPMPIVGAAERSREGPVSSGSKVKIRVPRSR